MKHYRRWNAIAWNSSLLLSHPANWLTLQRLNDTQYESPGSSEQFLCA